MKNFAIIAVFVLLLAVVGVRSRFVSIHYARMIDNQALSNPIIVDRVDGSRIRLSDGRTIQLDNGPLDTRWSSVLKAGSTIEIDHSDGDEYFTLWGNEPRSICGGTYAFRIPLIPHDVDRNRRGLIGLGSFSEESKEADQ